MKSTCMIAVLVAGLTLLSCEKNQTSIRTSEKTVIVRNNIDETIEKYISVRRILLTEFLKVKEDLMSKDKDNFYKIQNEIYRIISADRKNMDAQLITKYVNSVGSGNYINEYKALFYTIHNEQNVLSMYPDELVYTLDDTGRIVYFKAKNMICKGTSQEYDRSLLQRFAITKQMMKERCYYDFK